MLSHQCEDNIDFPIHADTIPPRAEPERPGENRSRRLIVRLERWPLGTASGVEIGLHVVLRPAILEGEQKPNMARRPDFTPDAVPGRLGRIAPPTQSTIPALKMGIRDYPDVSN